MGQMVALAFRKSDGGLMDWVISRRTNGGFCHVEIVFKTSTFPTHSLCFSSSQWDGGSRFKRIDLSEWTVIDVPTSDAAKVYAFCWAQRGKRYDWRSLFRYWLGWGKDASASRWFCSEVCVAALQAAGLFKGMTPAATSPEALWIAAKARYDAFAERNSAADCGR